MVRGSGARNRGRSKNGGRWYGNSRVSCQLYGKIRHTIVQCFHKFDKNFQGGNQGHWNTGNAGLSSQQFFSHEGGQFQENIHQANLHQNTTFYAILETVCDNAWHADSGVTNHVTSSLNNLNISTEFKGNEKLAVGNGHQLPISHIDKSYVYSPNLKTRAVALNDVLCVPLNNKEPCKHIKTNSRQ